MALYSIAASFLIMLFLALIFDLELTKCCFYVRLRFTITSRYIGLGRNYGIVFCLQKGKIKGFKKLQERNAVKLGTTAPCIKSNEWFN